MKLWPYSLVKVQCAVGLESQISCTELRIYGILEYIHVNIQSVLYARDLNKSHGNTEVGRDLCRSPRPSTLLEQGQPKLG